MLRLHPALRIFSLWPTSTMASSAGTSSPPGSVKAYSTEGGEVGRTLRDNTERSSVFDIARGRDWPSDWNLRTMRNSFTRRWSADMDGLRENLAAEQAHFEAASTAGDIDTAAVIIGEAADLIRGREPAQVTLKKMISQAEDRLRCLSRLVEPIKED